MACRDDVHRRPGTGKAGGPRTPTPLAQQIARACLAVLVLHACIGCHGTPRPPNVLLIVLDTVRADVVGAEWKGLDITPNLNRIAGEGIVFENSFSTAPWTLPSHATLFTGLLPSQHGAVHEHFLLTREHRTLAERLFAAGYATHGISSNPWVARSRGISQGFKGFEEIFLELEGRRDKGAGLASDRAIGFLEARREKERPFFLFVNMLEAHLPYAPPESAFEALGFDSSSLSRSEFSIHEAEEIITGERRASQGEIELARSLYWIEVAYQDRALGKLVDYMRREGILDQTLVIITADHGELFAQHGLMGHEFSLSDSLLRVPLVMRYPARAEAGKRIAEPVSHLDVLPTILDITGAERTPGEALSGLSLLGPQALPEQRSMLAEYSTPSTLLHGYWAARHPAFDTTQFDVALRSIRRGAYKLIEDSRGRVALFDPKADPAESQDRCGDMPAVCKALREELSAVGDRPPASPG